MFYNLIKEAVLPWDKLHLFKRDYKVSHKVDMMYLRILIMNMVCFFYTWIQNFTPVEFVNEKLTRLTFGAPYWPDF